MIMHTEQEGNINQYLSDTIAEVFPEVYTIDVAGTTNRELFASAQKGIIEDFAEEAENLSDKELKGMMQQIAGSMQCYEKGDYLLTDDKAPVELLGMQVIDELIQGELGYYKEIFREDGIQGILESM